MFFSAFIFGFLAAALALVFELVLIPPASFPSLTALSFTPGSILILIAIALIEELSKYLFLFRSLHLIPSSSLSLWQKAGLGIVFGLGFSALELILAFSQVAFTLDRGGLWGIALLHCLTSLVLMFCLPRVPQSRSMLLLPLLATTLLHLLYNSLLSFFLA